MDKIILLFKTVILEFINCIPKSVENSLNIRYKL